MYLEGETATKAQLSKFFTEPDQICANLDNAGLAWSVHNFTQFYGKLVHNFKTPLANGACLV